MTERFAKFVITAIILYFQLALSLHWEWAVSDRALSYWPSRVLDDCCECHGARKCDLNGFVGVGQLSCQCCVLDTRVLVAVCHWWSAVAANTTTTAAAAAIAAAAMTSRLLETLRLHLRLRSTACRQLFRYHSERDTDRQATTNAACGVLVHNSIVTATPTNGLDALSAAIQRNCIVRKAILSRSRAIYGWWRHCQSSYRNCL